jgi:hypothetical protein
VSALTLQSAKSEVRSEPSIIRMRVRRSEEVGVRRFEGPEDRIPLQFGFAKSKIPIRR